MDNKPINQFTDNELLNIIRRAENTDIAGSLYQRANIEWQIRHQQKMLEATQKTRSGVFINAHTIKNDGSIMGPTVDINTNEYSGKGDISSFSEKREPAKKWWKKPEVIIPIIISLLSISWLSDIFREKIFGKENGLDVTTRSITTIEQPKEKPDGILTTFTFEYAPITIIRDGVSMQKIASDGTVNWTGSSTITLIVAPNFDIYAQY